MAGRAIDVTAAQENLPGVDLDILRHGEKRDIREAFFKQGDIWYIRNHPNAFPNRLREFFGDRLFKLGLTPMAQSRLGLGLLLFGFLGMFLFSLLEKIPLVVLCGLMALIGECLAIVGAHMIEKHRFLVGEAERLHVYR